MSIFERYKKLIIDKKEEGALTEEFINQTKERLEVYLSKGKLTKDEYDELIGMLKED